MSMFVHYTILCLVFLKGSNAEGTILGFDEETFMTVPEIITKHGYECETHLITTEDGYILTAFRMNSKKVPKVKKEPIFVVHGLLGSSADYVLEGPENALGYILADSGFDVWLLNCRGTRYSLGHTSIPTWNSTYWDFSWHEMGIYDLPNTIDYILYVTKSQQVIHLGISQGTTVFYVMLSEKPEYNKFVKAHIAYAPSVFLCYMTDDLIKTFAMPEQHGMYTNLVNSTGNFNIVPQFTLLPLVIRMLCKPGQEILPICTTIVESLLNFDMKRIQAMQLFKHLGHLPAGASSKVMIHFAQIIMRCGFRKYQTGSEIPEKYNLNNIKVPVYVFYGEEDTMQTVDSIKKFEKSLRNCEKHFVPVENFGHIDLMISPDARAKVFDPTIEIINNLV